LLIDKVLEMRPKSVAFSGGEPLLVPEILSEARRLRAAGIEVRLYTSGSHMGTQFAEEVVRSVDYVHISVDGGSAEIHDHVRGRAGAFERALNTLERLCELRTGTGTSVVVDVCVLRRNVESLPQLCRELRSRRLPVDAVFLAATIPVGLASRESFAERELLSIEEHEQLRQDAVLWKSLLMPTTRLIVQDYFSLRMSDADIKRHPATAETMQVEADGEVRAIPIYEATVGNLLNERPDVLWKRAVEFRSSPVVRDLLNSISTPVEWAAVARRIDAEHCRPSELIRLKARAPYVGHSGDALGADQPNG
jgi:MoaA/NifB/PqqE/SkfB family radical SAM enzyme